MEKEITLTVADIAGAKESLDNVMAKELPVVTAWKLAKASKPINDEFDAYDKIRVETVRKYGKESETVAGAFEVPPGKVEAFQNELQKVLEQKVVITVPLISLEQLDGREFRPRDLALIWFLFEEEHDDESDQSDSEGQQGEVRSGPPDRSA